MPLTPEQLEKAYHIYDQTHKKRIGATGTWATPEEQEEKEAISRGLKLAKEEQKTPTTFLGAVKHEESIPYWTGEGEIKWRHKKLSEDQMNKLAYAKDVRLLRETADLGDHMEAFVQGILPVGDKELYEKAFPISNLGGHLTRLVGTSFLTSGIVDPVHSLMMNAKLPYIVSESIPRMTAFAVQRALTYGADELVGNITRGITGGELSFGKLVKEPLTEAGIGSLYGVAHGATGATLASSLAAGISGGRTLFREYVRDGKITKEDLTEAALMAGFTFLVERIGHEQVIAKWHDKETAQFAYDHAYAKYMGRGQTHNEALVSAAIDQSGLQHPHMIEGFARSVYERVIKPSLPQEFFTSDQKTQLEIISQVQQRIKDHMPIASAIGETMSRYMGELQKGLPFLAAKENLLYQRYEEPGIERSTVNKPQGIYTNPAKAKSIHAELGGKKFLWERNPQANILSINEIPSDKEITIRYGASNAGAGIWALREIIGKEKFINLKNTLKSELLTLFSKEYPNVQWNKYYDRQELLEAYAGLKAREAGYDAIELKGETLEDTEFVILTEKAAMPFATKLPFMGKRGIPLLPKFGTEKTVKPKEESKLVTPSLMRYGKELEKLLTTNFGYTDEDFKELKGGKSFSYKKENAMASREAAQVINDYEDLIEQSVYLGEGHKKLLKEMDILRAKMIKTKDKGIFDDLVKMAIPEELKDQIGAKFYLTDWVRPSWRVFRKDPIVNKHGYLPMADGYGKAKRFAETSILEAHQKVKELKLTPDERRRVTIKRHIEYFWSIGQDLHRELPTLNSRERQWDDWLTSHFEGLHKFFHVDRVVPYNLYIPLLQDIEVFEKSYLNELYPDYLPKNITAFFEHRRKSKDAEKFREDSLDLYEMYVRAGAKKHYMLTAIREARKNVIKNRLVDPTMKSHFQDWGTWMMGYPAMADATFTAMFEKLGLDYDQAYTVARTMMNLTYMGGIGFRPLAAMRNLLQNLNTACELGYTWMGAGLVEFTREGSNRARDLDVLMEYAPEIYTELGQHTEMQKLMHASMFLYRKADELNRSVAYYSAEKKFNYYFQRYGNTDRFLKESGIRYLHKSKQAEIKALLDDGKPDKARDVFGKEIAAKTQYLYKKETSPLIQKTLPGKLLFQFKSWPENYLELMNDWYQNKNYAAWARALLAYSMLGFIGNVLGQKWIKKSIPIGTLPVEQWRFERMFIPATLGPIADIMFLMTSPLYTGLETQDPDKVAKEFKKRVDRLGKDILLYIPGGLAMKDLYNMAAFIPFNTPGQQESGRLEMETMPTQNRLPIGRL